MNSFTMSVPTEVIFGSGTIQKLPEVVLRYGACVLMVTTPWVGEQELAFEKVKKSMEEKGITVVVHDDVVSNPTSDSINDGVIKAREAGCQVILGVGGGSSIDSAKAIAVGVKHEGVAWDYVYTNGKTVIPELVLPIIAVPTTSGTGSHVTKYAVFTNRDLEVKSTIVNPAVYPKVSVVDPDLMKTLPDFLTASVGFDAFSHSFESYTNINSNDFIDMLALRSMELIVNNLYDVMRNPNDTDLREKLAFADTLAGISIANVGTTLPHSIGQPISGRYPNVSHGLSLAVIYPQFLEFTYKNCVGKFAKVARIFDPSLNEKDDLAAAEALSGCMREFLKKIGMYTSLELLHVSDEKMDGIVRDAMNCPDTYVTPAVPTEEQVRMMLNDAKTLK